MIEKTKAIVIHYVKYGDDQLIVDLFTEKFGRLSFIVRIPKSSKSKMKRQYFQPLMVLDIEFDHRPKLNLQHFKNVSIGIPFSDIPFSPFKVSISLFLAELLYHSTRNEQSNIALFQFLLKSLEWLDTASDGFANFHIVFMIHLSLFLGFSPNLESHENEEYFDMEEGRLVSGVPLHQHHLDKEKSMRMKKLVRLNYTTMRLYSMSRTERNQCVDAILEYYRLHVPDFPEMKTLKVLQDLFV